MLHLLDHSTSTLLDPKNFKSRNEISKSQSKNLESIVRRLYRIFSHTYFHHEEIFNQFEQKTWLCTRFTYFAKQCKMMPSDLFIIPN